MLDKDRLHAELADDLRRGIVLPAKAAALFDLDEGALRRLCVEAYPVSLPDTAVSIVTKQLLAAVEQARRGGSVSEALQRLAASPSGAHVVQLVIAARGRRG